MLGKLSIRNAKRQAKDYVIYFITVIISVALMFSFNSIAVSKDIIELSTYMEHFSKAITGVSIIIIFVMAWLINYTMKFMLEKRSKEFGTYQILGIEKKDLPKLISKLEKDMHKAAKILDFERAAEIRDQLKKLREMVN